MRSKLLARFSFILLAFAYWWLGATKPMSTASRPSARNPNLSSPKDQVTAATADQPRVGYFRKSVGVHQGPLIAFNARRGKPGEGGHDSSPMQRFAGLKMTDPVNMNGRPEFILGARAVPNAQYNSSYGPVLFVQNGFSIVALNTEADSSWQDLVMHEKDRPLVVNPANGRMGIVTGTLIVKLADTHQADKIAGREGFQLLSVDESINTAYFHVPENYHMLSGATKLSQDPSVLRVEFEVVEGNKEAR